MAQCSGWIHVAGHWDSGSGKTKFGDFLGHVLLTGGNILGVSQRRSSSPLLTNVMCPYHPPLHILLGWGECGGHTNTSKDW